MDSIASTHARLAALIRHRGENDPEVLAARRALEVARAEGTTIRRRVGLISSADRKQLLLALDDREGAAS